MMYKFAICLVGLASLVASCGKDEDVSRLHPTPAPILEKNKVETLEKEVPKKTAESDAPKRETQGKRFTLYTPEVPKDGEASFQLKNESQTYAFTKEHVKRCELSDPHDVGAGTLRVIFDVAQADDARNFQLHLYRFDIRTGTHILNDDTRGLVLFEAGNAPERSFASTFSPLGESTLCTTNFSLSEGILTGEIACTNLIQRRDFQTRMNISGTFRCALNDRRRAR